MVERLASPRGNAGATLAAGRLAPRAAERLAADAESDSARERRGADSGVRPQGYAVRVRSLGEAIGRAARALKRRSGLAAGRGNELRPLLFRYFTTNRKSRPAAAQERGLRPLSRGEGNRQPVRGSGRWVNRPPIGRRDGR